MGRYPAPGKIDGANCQGIGFAGEIEVGLNFENATLIQGVDNAFLGIGTYSTPKTVVVTDNYLPLQVNLLATGNVNKTIAAGYFKVQNDEDTEELQLCGLLARLDLAYDVDSAYGVQSHIAISQEMQTKTSLYNIAAGSFKIELDNAVAQGQLSAGLFIIEGDASAENTNVVMINVEETATVHSLVSLGIGAGATCGALFDISDSGGDVTVATAKANDGQASIKIKVNGADRWLHTWDAAA